jgi:A/G-specific adenine glycosylase
MKRFRDIHTVLKSKDDVITSFKSLGLPVRGQRIVDLSIILREKHSGRVPQSKEDLLVLPSIGEYIAEAVRVFAFGIRGTVIDTNVVRIVSRFFGLEATGELRRNSGLKDICDMVSSRIDASEIKNLNWALLDFGAAICKPRPLCNRCPLYKKCIYFKRNIFT